MIQPSAAPVAGDGPEIASLIKPKSGKAPPFWLWDRTIPDFGLSFRDQSVLIYLCRRTFGYGKYHGDYIAWREIAHGCACDRMSAKRAVQSLLRRGLVVYKPQELSENGVGKAAFIGVILPGWWEPAQPDNEPNSRGGGESQDSPGGSHSAPGGESQ